MNKEEIKEEFEQWFRQTRSPAGVGFPPNTNQVADFWLNQIDSLLESIEKDGEKMKKTLPKDPLDMTFRESMNQVMQPVYRPYVSNEESYNNGVSDVLDLLKAKREKK